MPTQENFLEKNHLFQVSSSLSTFLVGSPSVEGTIHSPHDPRVSSNQLTVRLLPIRNLVFINAHRVSIQPLFFFLPWSQCAPIGITHHRLFHPRSLLIENKNYSTFLSLIQTCPSDLSKILQSRVSSKVFRISSVNSQTTRGKFFCRTR